MQKYIFSLLSLLCTLGFTNAQVGIGLPQNTVPAATLEIKADATNATSIDGIRAPRFTKIELINKKLPTGVYSYNTSHKGTYVFVTDITLNNVTDITETKGIVEKGLYYFNGKIWVGISSELGKISIYASASTNSASLTSNGFGVQNFENQRKALFLNFGTNDIIYEGVTTLMQQENISMAAGGTQNSSYFKILENGMYEISGYIILNPYYGELSLATTDFVAINLFFTTSANTINYPNYAVAPNNPLTGVRSVIIGPNAGIPDIIYIPPTIVELTAGTNIYFSAVNPALSISTTGKQVKNDAANNKNNISRFFAGEELFPYEKYVSIRKL